MRRKRQFRPRAVFARARFESLSLSLSAEIAVVGAGPAGATLARLLALRGKRVAVLDPGNKITDRLELLAPSARSVLQALAIVELVESSVIGVPCAGIRRRWGTHEIEYDDFLRQPHGLGTVVDRAKLDMRLRELAIEAGAFFVEARASAVQRSKQGFEIVASQKLNTLTIVAPIVVDASGRPSVLARRLDARRTCSERLLAERVLVNECEGPRQGPVWLDVEGSAGSWDYTMSGPNGRREKWTVYRNNGRFQDRTRHQVNASSSCLSPAAGEGWIAIGDAATAFDPITSQGLINALSSALVAAGAIMFPGGLSMEAAAIYSEAVAATFANTESGRSAVYQALT
ncbi:NAD(P)/FAD-dependent oxidoreductase [Bradyrhizobium jicamae]|uniref:NAD(P)/FAD-dependent oxidoreductase n=1 Tax=Bradyrhizobium jicamae TaxID=280332 RepID=UPI0012EDE157|nr:NAD(P)/FAD-dependent oxidoreductase [Bradyrhizobium jicamae]